MTEEEARDHVAQLTDRIGMLRLERLVALVLAENERQNLIAASTTTMIWNRHILDSVQLLQWAGEPDEQWLDIGTGGGFPGLAIAAASPRSMVLVEPRRRRAEFLRDAAQTLSLDDVSVRAQKVEAMREMKADVISARAVASIGKLLGSACHCAIDDTRWLLLRGSSYQADLHNVESEWGGVFHVKQSLSEADAAVIVACGVARR